MKTETKSFIRWAGSKRKLVPTLKEYWDISYAKYIEPFAGSAQLFYSITADNYLLSDKNYELIEMYKQIQKDPYSVYKILKTLKNSKAEYYKIRALNPKTLGINQRAARFIYLNWLCFNGLYRTNNSGQFNVPYSNETDKTLDNWQLLLNCSKKLKQATILQGDFETVVKENLSRNSFVYLDPPYAVENVRIFTQYGNQTFGINDLERLSKLLYYINKNGSYFLVSYAKCNEALEFFKNWKIREVSVQRNIAGFITHRRKAKEILVTNI